MNKTIYSFHNIETINWIPLALFTSVFGGSRFLSIQFQPTIFLSLVSDIRLLDSFSTIFAETEAPS